MSDVNDIPVVQKAPPKLSSIKELNRSLAKEVAAAIDLFVAVMNDPKQKIAIRLAAARDVANYYIKTTQLVEDAVLTEQQKRRNALKINRMVDENERARNSGAVTPAPNILEFDVQPESYS